MAGSALKADVGSVGKLIRGSSVTEPGPFALSDRQVELNALWARYKCQAYAGRKTDWNGHQNTDNLETEAIATAGFLPAGFYAAGDSFPLKYRKPSVPYYLTKIVVDRITGLLFSSGRHPKVTVEGDADTQEWLTGFVEDSRLWARMVMARTMGGAMGTVAIGLKFVRGKPRIEVHDARWLFPVFSDPEEFELEALEKRYTFPEEVYDEDEGAWKQKWFWYRRVITDTHDTVWARVPVPEDDPQRLPIWAKEDHTEVAHDFGFCPVVWIQNHEVQDSVDGAPDAEGAADLIAAIDCLLSQAQKGTVANCDPTVLMATDGDFEEVAKGSDNAIKLEKGGTASYLEITGAGPRTALELAKDFEDRVQKICRVVFDTNLSGPARTAAEVNRNYSSMLENADMLREQYGERGVKRLLQMAVDAGRKLRGPQEVIDADGKKTKITRAIILSPKVELDETGNTVPVQRRLGPGGEIKLVWPDYFDPTNLDIVQAVDAVTRALTAKLITQEQAIEFVAHYFGVEDITEVLEKGTATHELEMQKLMGKIALANAQARIPGGMVPPPGGPQPGGPANPQPVGAGPAPGAPGAPPGALSPNFGSP